MEERNFFGLDYKQCTGCGMCADICANQAIKMVQDEEGFYYPVVEEMNCKNCGKCVSRCPQYNDLHLHNEVKKTYAVVCDDEIRGKCSSGGVFGAVAQYVISQKGLVFGASYINDFKEVRHICVDNEKDLLKLYKSKYLQSNTATVFSEIKENLRKSDSPVVFCGCPCQVASLKSFLGNDYDNLILIDLLCHGAASPGVYKKFLEDVILETEEKIINVDFRDKKRGWNAKDLVIEMTDGNRVIDREYMKAFLWGYSQREVCFNCKYAKKERVGDITLGDFWGIERINAELNDYKGTSLVLCNTEKGNMVIDSIKDWVKKIEEFSFSDVFEKISDMNWALAKSGIRPQNREIFFYRLQRGDRFKQAFRYASCGTFDVGIFGWWFEDDWTNYGSTLTYYALMDYISSLGLTTTMITSPFHDKKDASDFIQTHGYRMTETYDFNSFHKHNDNIATFLLGSDQLWYYDCYKNWKHLLFLDFVGEEKKRIAYATSFGHENPNIPDEEKPLLKECLQKFDAISVREFEGVNILSQIFGIEAVQTMDPVFICEKSIWGNLADEAERKTRGEYVFAYVLDPSKEKVELINEFAEALKCPVVSVTDKQYDREKKEKLLEGVGILNNASIAELIYHLKNAKFIITDSFHGTCFSLIFRKRFLAFANQARGKARFKTLSGILGIEERILFDKDFSSISVDKYLQMDYSDIIPKLEREISRSRAWLSDKLFDNKKMYSHIESDDPEMESKKTKILPNDIREMVDNRLVGTGKSTVFESLDRQYYKTKYGLSDYHLSFITKIESLFNLKDARVLEIGGSNMPYELIADGLKVKKWVSLDMPWWKGSDNPHREHPVPVIPIDSFTKEQMEDVEEYKYVVVEGLTDDITPVFYDEFDIIVSNCCFEHVMDMPRAFENMYLSLKEGGGGYSSFSPIWSAYNGHHAWLSDDIGVKFGDLKFFPPHGHLFMSEMEIYQLLKAHCPNSRNLEKDSKKLKYGNDVNRLFYEDYENCLKQSKFTNYIMVPSYEAIVPEKIMELLCDMYKPYKKFNYWGINMFFSK